MIPPRTKFEWRHLQALCDLYEKGATSLKLDNAYIKSFLIKRREWISLKEKAKSGYVVSRDKRQAFRNWYESELKEDIAQYQRFLEKYELPDDGRRSYTNKDLNTLIVIDLQKKNLLVDIDHVTLEKFSSDFFGGSKYLKDHKTVRDTVLKVLGIGEFKGQKPRDHLYRLVVDCPGAEVVVLCENKDFLRIPDRALEAKIELWYVGGNNMGAIDRISPEKLKLPLYYSCDWDDEGLAIFIRICKRLFDDRSGEEKRRVTLLYPTAVGKDYRFPVDSPNHNSKWDHNQIDSGLDLKWFSMEDIQLFRELIATDQWIEEQKNDLVKMVSRARSNN
ncbi:hypothetical protein GCM10028808_27200 [Spirosoma migulaei]